jgi:hypothetical protein
MYRSNKFVVANPLACPKNVPTSIRVPLVHKAQPWVPLRHAFVIPTFSFQLIPLIWIIPK